jgi:hypothetical protein
MKLLRLAVVGIAIAGSVAACGGSGGGAYVAKVGSHPITQKQLDAVLLYDRSQYPKQHLTFPRTGSAEYLLLREQAIDYLVGQSRAHQVDARIGVPPQDQVVSDAAFLKVTANVRVTPADVQRYLRQHRTKEPASEIRQLLLEKRRAVVMHGFVAAARRDYPVTYPRGTKRVSEIALAQKIWALKRTYKYCDLRPGMYQYPIAVEHGCVEDSGTTGLSANEPPCAIVDPPHSNGGFTSAEEDDGFAEYDMDNAGTCAGDPRDGEVQITAEDNTTPVTVSYLHGAGTAILADDRYGISLHYPRRLHMLKLRYAGDLAGGSDGIEISNFDLKLPSLKRTLPPDGIDVAFLAAVTDFVTYPGARDSTFPVSLAGHTLRGTTTIVSFQADGDRYSIVIREGTQPSAQDQAAVRELVTSIRFQANRRGAFTASGFYVLGRASDYTLGSVTRIRGGVKLPNPPNPGQVLRSRPFYLVHAKDEFVELAWPKRSLCGVRYDAAHRLFRCRDGTAWNLHGRVLGHPNAVTYSNDQPYTSPAPVSFDGYVLVNVSVTG